MVNKDRYLLLGGAISLIFWALLFAVIYILLHQDNTQLHYSLKEDSIVVVSLDEIKTKRPEIQKEQTKPKKVVKASQQTQDADPFASLKTKSITYSTSTKVAEVKPLVSEDLFKKIHTKETTLQEKRHTTKRDAIAFKKVDINTSVAASKDIPGIKDAYRVKLRDRLTKAWVQTSDLAGNYQAKVLVTITPTGRFTYKIRHLAGYAPFDKELEIFLYNQSQKSFDAPPNAHALSVDINFIARSKD